MTILELPRRVELQLGSLITPLGMELLRCDLYGRSQEVDSVKGLDFYNWQGDYAELQWTEARGTMFQLLALGLKDNKLLGANREACEFREKLAANTVSCADVLTQLSMEDTRRARILGMSGYGNMIPMTRVIDYYSRIAFIE